MTQAISPSAITPGLPCRTCQGASFFDREIGSACPACGGRGQGSAVLLPFSCLAEITPGLAGWAWTILCEGTPVDGGVRATEEAALAAVAGWAAADKARKADAITAEILSDAISALGFTEQAFAAAFAAVALSSAFQEEES